MAESKLDRTAGFKMKDAPFDLNVSARRRDACAVPARACPVRYGVPRKPYCFIFRQSVTALILRAAAVSRRLP